MKISVFSARHLSYWRGPFLASGVLAALIFTVFYLQWEVSHWLATPIDDFAFYFTGARVLLERGPGYLYDGVAQASVLRTIAPGITLSTLSYFVYPAPLAWLVLPLALLPYSAAHVIWIVSMLVCLVVGTYLVSPGRFRDKSAWVLVTLGFSPVALSLYFGQPMPIVFLAIALSWWLAQSRREFLGGIVLALIVVKPQSATWLPLVLLVAGYRRVVLGFVCAVSLMAIVTIVSIGQKGLVDLVALLIPVSKLPLSFLDTSSHLLGTGSLWLSSVGILFVIVFVSVRLHRVPNLSMTYAMGILFSIIAAKYLHGFDLGILLLAGWLSLRSGLGGWFTVFLLIPLICVEFASTALAFGQWEILIVWLVLLAAHSFFSRASSRVVASSL